MDETAGAWGAPQEIVGSVSLSSVSCPSDGDCTAAGSSGYGGQALAVSESGGTWGTAEVLPGPLNTDAGLTSISCSSPGKCSAGGYYDAQPDGPLPGEGYPLVAEETGGTWGSVQDLNGSFNDVAAMMSTLSRRCRAPRLATAARAVITVPSTALRTRSSCPKPRHVGTGGGDRPVA